MAISPAATLARMWSLMPHVVIPAFVLGPLLKSDTMIRKSSQWMWQGFPIEDGISAMRTITFMAGIPRHGPPRVLSDQELQRIRSPVLLLIGDHEVIYKPDAVIRRALRLMPNVKAAVVTNANHNAEYTAADTVNERVMEFFEAQP